LNQYKKFISVTVTVPSIVTEEAPPRFAEVSSRATEEAPPPSYNSIFSQFKAIKDESGNNPLTIASKVSDIVSGSGNIWN
jgi:hypothetical protein